MNHSMIKLATALCAIGTLSACTDVKFTHSPVVATVNDQITFTADVDTAMTPTDLEIQLIVNAALVKTCTSSPCTYTGGPYPTYEDTYVSFRTNVVAEYNVLGMDFTESIHDGYNYTGIADANYNWNSSDYIPARYTGATSDKEDLVFHMASDYADNGQDFGDFLDDVEDKIYDIFAEQEIIKSNMDKFNFYVYQNEAEASGCGTVHADANSDMPWRDDDAVLHFENFQDCTNAGLSHFSAEGHNTKAFLHESGHAVFGLGDEYDGPTNYSIVQSPEPNIFDTQAKCQTEQNNKGRDPSVCYQFTTRDGGWWGIHSGNTVMVRGNLGDPWGEEGEERVNWYFDNL